MVEISDSVRLLFETSFEEDGDQYIVPIPKELVEGGSISKDSTYRVALLSPASPSKHIETTTESTPPESDLDDSQTKMSDGTGSSSDFRTQQPPVEQGEVRSVTIDTPGDQGDGIAKVERGFIVIVPETQPGDQVDVEITDVRETVAFAETVSEPTVR